MIECVRISPAAFSTVATGPPELVDSATAPPGMLTDAGDDPQYVPDACTGLRAAISASPPTTSCLENPFIGLPPSVVTGAGISLCLFCEYQNSFTRRDIFLYEQVKFARDLVPAAASSSEPGL